MDSRDEANRTDQQQYRSKSAPPGAPNQSLRDALDSNQYLHELIERSERLPKKYSDEPIADEPIFDQLINKDQHMMEAFMQVPSNYYYYYDYYAGNSIFDGTQVKEADREQQVLSETTGPITTLMICDIPCRKSIMQLVDAIHMYGFVDTYDLVYMPCRMMNRHDSGNGRTGNVGYAFVNFKAPEYAAEFLRAFRNIPFPHSNTTKLSYAKPARVQGYEANLEMHNSKPRMPGALITHR